MNRTLFLIPFFTLFSACASSPEPVPCNVPRYCEQLNLDRVVAESEDLMRQDRFMQSIEVLSAAYVCHESPILLFHRGQVYRSAGQYEVAIEYYEEYLRTRHEAKRNEALAAVAECQSAVSLPPVETVLGDSPCDVPLQNLAENGAAYFEANLYDEAIVIFQNAYDCQPDPILTYNIGRVHQAAGHCGRARDAFQSYVDSSDNRLRDQAIEYLNEMAACAAH